MVDISGSDLISKIENETLGTAIQGLITGETPAMTPAALIFELVEAYYSAQLEFNEVTTTPEKITTFGGSQLGSLQEVEGKIFRQITRSMSFRKEFTEGDITSDYLVI